MGTNQYDIQKKQLKAQAKETRRQAGIAYKSGMEQAGEITQESNASLSQAMALLGKTGNLGVANDAIDFKGIESGVDTGSLKGDSVKSLEGKDYESKAKELTDKIADLKKKQDDYYADRDGTTAFKKYDPDIRSLEKELKAVKKDQKNLSIITKDIDKIGDISAGETANLTSGSTALNLKTFQDKLTKARNKYVNQVQEDVYSALLNAKNMNAQATLAGKASGWQNFSTILNFAASGIGAVI